MTKLWRLHIRPKGGKGDAAASVALCLDRSIIGMGWPVPEETVTRSNDFEWYKDAATRQYQPDKSWWSVWRFALEAKVNDLVWFRNTQGRFYLAELLEPWIYAREDAEAIDADIVNWRKARIVEVGLADAVPGKVIACFRPSMTFQAIDSPGMLAFSAKLAGLPFDGDAVYDPYEFMTDVDLENVVLVYLQTVGWYVLPGTRSMTTAHYECVLVDRQTGERAMVQVKSGGSAIDAASYAGEERAFLFAASGQYGSSRPQNVAIITRQELNDFMRDMPHLLPQAVRTWLAMLSE